MALTEVFKGEFEELTPKTAQQVLNETRIIDGPSDGLYNRSNLKYKWAKEFFDVMRQNNWMETECPMQKDKEQWESGVLTDQEKKCFLRFLAFASNLDGTLTDSLSDVIAKHITSTEISLALKRQIYEESLHVESYAYLIESIGLDPNDVYLLYQKDKDLFYKNKQVLEGIYEIYREDFDITTLEGKKEFLLACVTNLIFEGIFFYSVFLIFYNFGRHNKMPGSKKMIQFINRDEDIHVQLFVNIINTIKEEYPEVWTEEVKSKIVNKLVTASELEVEWGNSCIGNGILGLTPDILEPYIQFVTDVRLQALGLPKQFNAKNTCKWVDQFTQGNMTETNFFEEKLTEYQSGSLEW